MSAKELIIKGEKVNNVGYRPFLLLNALNLGIENLFAFNAAAGELESVVLRVEGEDEQIANYIEYVKANYPPHAIVSAIEVKDFSGRVGDAFKYAQILQLEQMYKAIPAIISIDKKQDIMIEKQDIMIEKQDIMIGKQDIMIGKQDIMIGKQDIMIGKQDIMIGKQDAATGILRDVSENTSVTREDISVLRRDTSESLSQKYEELRREIIEIKETISELKARAA